MTKTNSRVDSIANFHIARFSQGKMFHDTDSDEEIIANSKYDLNRNEEEPEENFKQTIIIKSKSRGVSISGVRTLSITREAPKNKQKLIQKGFMSKRSPSLIQCWQRRFFVLTNHRLQYYKTEQDFINKKPPRGILNFQQICIESEYKDIQMIIFMRIRGEQRIFQFRCLNQNDYDIWKEKLQEIIDKSQGKLNKLDIGQYKSDINPNSKFWRHIRITEQEFEDKADTGDIILCSNVKKDNQVRYEAAFLLFKMEDTIDLIQKGLYVLSPSQTQNDIILGTWEQFKDFHLENYTDICLRQLKIDRDEQFMDQSDNFMNELREKPHFGDGKLESKRSYTYVELILKYLRCLQMVKQKVFIKDERKFQVNALSQIHSWQLSLNGKDLLGEEQYLMLSNYSGISNTLTDQDQIQRMFDEIQNQKKVNSLSDFEIENCKDVEPEYQEESPYKKQLTQKDKEEFIQGELKQ